MIRYRFEEGGMIEKGDGTMQKQLSVGACPKCYSKMDRVSSDETKTKYKCNVCGLRVNDYKTDGISS